MVESVLSCLVDHEAMRAKIRLDLWSYGTFWCDSQSKWLCMAKASEWIKVSLGGNVITICCNNLTILQYAWQAARTHGWMHLIVLVAHKGTIVALVYYILEICKDWKVQYVWCVDPTIEVWHIFFVKESLNLDCFCFTSFNGCVAMMVSAHYPQSILWIWNS